VLVDREDITNLTTQEHVMNANRKYLALTAVIALITIGIGVFFFAGSTGSTAGGQISLSFDPEPGTYVVTATEPTGYRARDDKDGGASNNAGLTCSSVYLCIYLTATEVQDAAGNKSIVVTLAHVRPERVDELDDLWFEMTPPAAAEEETSLIEPADDDILIGEPGNDQLIDQQDDGGLDLDSSEVGDILIGDPSDDSLGNDVIFPPAPSLTQICVNTQHQPVPEQNAASGIWVRGEVYGLDGGWIFIEGPSINGGNPVEIPVNDGIFDAPLGINNYGDHDVTRFELLSNDPAANPVDLLPTLTGGPGAVFPVGPDNGPVFDNECFDFDPPVITDDTKTQPEAATELTAEEELALAMQAATTQVDMFLVDFVEDHTTNDAAGLLETLHPTVPLAFGDDTCSEYVARTTGSIAGATVLDVQLPQSIDMDTPNGAITFPEAIPFTVEFTLTDGSTVVNEANLALHDGELHWLTRCGN
jgi:hypothetical protein